MEIEIIKGRKVKFSTLVELDKKLDEIDAKSRNKIMKNKLIISEENKVSRAIKKIRKALKETQQDQSKI